MLTTVTGGRNAGRSPAAARLAVPRSLTRKDELLAVRRRVRTGAVSGHWPITPRGSPADHAVVLTTRSKPRRTEPRPGVPPRSKRRARRGRAQLDHLEPAPRGAQKVGEDTLDRAGRRRREDGPERERRSGATHCVLRERHIATARTSGGLVATRGRGRGGLSALRRRPTLRRRECATFRWPGVARWGRWQPSVGCGSSGGTSRGWSRRSSSSRC